MHRDRLDEVLPIVADMIYRPSFTDEDWQRVQQQKIFSAQQSRKDPRSVSYQFAGYFLHGADHPMGVPSSGTPETIGNLSKEEVQRWHQSRLIGSNVSFVLVGFGSLIGFVDCCSPLGHVDCAIHVSVIGDGDLIHPTLLDGWNEVFHTDCAIQY